MDVAVRRSVPVLRTNPEAADVTEKPHLLSRSLVCLRLELRQSRCATSAKLRSAFETRLEDNARAVHTLLDHASFWKHIGGPDPEVHLQQPSPESLAAAHLAVVRGEACVAAKPDDPDLESLMAEIKQAVSNLRVCSWEAIRKERFNMTPPGLAAQFMLARWNFLFVGVHSV